MMTENPIEKLFWGKVRTEEVWPFCFYVKGERMQHILHTIKYKGGEALAEKMGQLFGQDIAHTTAPRADLLLPIPLSEKKIKSRGYNQAEAIAKGISRYTQIPVATHLLIKSRHTQTQTQISKYSRWLNVESVFNITDTLALENKKVWIVDDVITTGATLESAIHLLNGIPGCKTGVLALAAAEHL